jgi:hypothetical protein
MQNKQSRLKYGSQNMILTVYFGEAGLQKYHINDIPAIISHLMAELMYIYTPDQIKFILYVKLTVLLIQLQ